MNMNFKDTNGLNFKNDCNVIFPVAKRSSGISLKYTSEGKAVKGIIETSKIQAKIS